METNQNNSNIEGQNNTETKLTLPSPNKISKIVDFKIFYSAQTEKLGTNNFTLSAATRPLTINTNTPDVYRAAVNFLKDNNLEFHTYQMETTNHSE